MRRLIPRGRQVKLFIYVVLLFLCCAGNCSNGHAGQETTDEFVYDSQSDYWPTSGWKYTSPEKQGMLSQHFTSMFKEINDGNYYISSQEPESRQKDSPYFFHQPYSSDKCRACHESDNLGKIITEPDRLCNYCHDSFSDIYSNIHGPADSGKCMLCHDPHMSKNKSMLRQTGRELCTYCHQEDQLSEKSHPEGAEINCVKCHNPHGGGQYYLLK